MKMKVIKMTINTVDEPIITVRRSQYPTDNKPEFLLLGRSNVGKSSFINSILEYLVNLVKHKP